MLIKRITQEQYERNTKFPRSYSLINEDGRIYVYINILNDEEIEPVIFDNAKFKLDIDENVNILTIYTYRNIRFSYETYYYEIEMFLNDIQPGEMENQYVFSQDNNNFMIIDDINIDVFAIIREKRRNKPQA